MHVSNRASLIRLTALLVCHSLAPDVAADDISVIARDVCLDNKIVRIQAPLGEQAFTIEWIDSNNGKHAVMLHTRTGNHAYDLRKYRNSWRGTARQVAVRGIKAPVLIQKPRWTDNLAIFATPEQYLAGTVNGFRGHSLCGYGATAILLAMALLISLVASFKSTLLLPQTLLTGFLAAFIPTLILTVYDDICIMASTDRNAYLSSVKSIQSVGNQCHIVMTNETWSSNGLAPFYQEHLAYCLAEHPFLPSTQADKADILIKPIGSHISISRRKQLQ